MIKEYKITQHNSTVCGYPGHDYDWSKFDWEGKTRHFDRCNHQGCTHSHVYQAPVAFVDGNASEYYEYLHVAYDYEQQATIFRIRPNDCMEVGKIYRGHLVKSVKAVKKSDGWYWQLQQEVMI